MPLQKHAQEAQNLLRSRLCNPNFVFKALSDSPDSNYSKLKFIISSSVTEACNNSLLLLGPRGSGKIAVLELVLNDLLEEYPDRISVIRLNGLIHNDDNCAFKASFDDNSKFLIDVLRECGPAHKTIAFVLEEFDLFAQDADQLLEKRVRSRFSHRKLLFLSPPKETVERLLQHILLLPMDTTLPNHYVTQFNAKLQSVFADKGFKELLNNYLSSNSAVGHLLRFLFIAVSSIDLKSGYPSLENFKTAFSSFQRQPKLECIKDCSILELYLLVCMRRLEWKEQSSYNFNSIMKEYKAIYDQFKTSDNYARNVCLRAFEHLLQRDLICFLDKRVNGQSVEFRPVKCLISHIELQQGIEAYRSCPVSSFPNYSSPMELGPEHSLESLEGLKSQSTTVKANLRVCSNAYSSSIQSLEGLKSHHCLVWFE
ncbi:Origin of replication complex subunit 4 [Linum perenne]